MTDSKQDQGTSSSRASQSTAPHAWSDGWLDYQWEGTRQNHYTTPYGQSWFAYNQMENPNDFTRHKEGDFADAYPVLAPFYPIQTPDLWLDPWLTQDYHGYWW